MYKELDYRGEIVSFGKICSECVTTCFYSVDSFDCVIFHFFVVID